MPQEPYLLRLANRLSDGLADWEIERRERHRRFVLAHQMSDGGFRGREGESDIYYTSFAVRCLSMLGGMNAEEATAIGGFLQSHDWRTLSIVDLLSWLSSSVVVQLAGGPDVFADDVVDWPQQIAQRLESVRTDDGGYAKSSEGAAGSTYQSFLVVLAYELIGQPLPRPNALVQFLFDRQRDDGGFVEIAPMKRSGTNPTAAAVATLGILNYLDREIGEDVTAFLRDVRSDEGGFQANTRIPFADGLSTFTGLLTLGEIQRERLIDRGQARQFFTDWLEFPTGGFRGASWDEQADVEYTFYGLGAMALLSESV